MLAYLTSMLNMVESQRRPEYLLLQKVSHWTSADVERERQITQKGHKFHPSVVLENSFREIFSHCDFEEFHGKRNGI